MNEGMYELWAGGGMPSSTLSSLQELPEVPLVALCSQGLQARTAFLEAIFYQGN